MPYLQIALLISYRRRRQLRQIWKPVGGGRPSPDGSSVGWSAAPHHAVPAHVFPQAVHELHGDGAAGFRREWTQLRPRGDDPEAVPLTGKTSSKVASAAAHCEWIGIGAILFHFWFRCYPSR